MPPNNNKGEKTMKSNTVCGCLSIEQIEKIVVEKMSAQFEERFNRLKDNVVSLMAEKLSVLIEENNILKDTVTTDLENLHEWQKYIDKKVQEIDTETETVKKRVTVIHKLVETFNSNLIKIEEKSKQSTQDSQVIESERAEEKREFEPLHKLVGTLQSKINQLEDSQSESNNCTCEGEIESMRNMVSEMLSEVPNCSAILEGFKNMEEHLEQCNLLESRVSQLEIPQSSTDAGLHSSMKSTFDSHLISSITNELSERKTREANFVIHNLPETPIENDDIERVKEIIEEIMQVDCTEELQRDIYTSKPNIYRMGGRADGKKRTVKVHLTSAKLRENIISNSRRLADSVKYKTVVVQRDLSILERQHLRQLVAEKKRRNNIAITANQEPDWKIYNGTLVRKSSSRVASHFKQY